MLGNKGSETPESGKRKNKQTKKNQRVKANKQRKKSRYLSALKAIK